LTKLVKDKNTTRFLYAPTHIISRTVTRKLSIGGLYVCAVGLDSENWLKNPLIYSVSYFNLVGLVLSLGGRAHQIPSWR